MNTENGLFQLGITPTTVRLTYPFPWMDAFFFRDLLVAEEDAKLSVFQ